jgi:hypothetical protein
MSGHEIREFPAEGSGRARWFSAPTAAPAPLRFDDVCAALGVTPRVPLEFEHRWSNTRNVWEVRLIGDGGESVSEWHVVRPKEEK